jgi:CheY-like chemotaxis protein
VAPRVKHQGHDRDATRYIRPKTITHHNPSVVIYDIAVPYEDNWTLFETLRQLPEAHGRAFVVTTVNKRVFVQRLGKRM